MLKRVFEFVSCFIYWRPGFFFLFYSKGEKPFQLTIVMMHSLVILIVWNRLRIFCLYLHPPLKKKKIPPQQKKKLLFKLLTSCNSEKKHQLCIDRSYFFQKDLSCNWCFRLNTFYLKSHLSAGDKTAVK